MGKQSNGLEGARELQRLLRKLPDKIHRKVTRQAVNAALNPILKTARKNVPVDEAVLKKSLAKRVRTYKRSLSIVGITGPRDKAAPHMWLVEYGSGPRVQKDGSSTGEMPPSGFMRRARDQATPESAAVMKKKMTEGVHREAERARNEGKRR